jgi:hypothetical protein
MAWFRGLRRPAIQLPLPAFLALAAVYYAQPGTVLYRAAREDEHPQRLALLLLPDFEIWKGVFFGRRRYRSNC